MTDTPTPRRAGSRKTLAFLIGGFILVAAVAVAYFADRGVLGSNGAAIAPPVSTAPPAPVANPAEPAASAAPSTPVPAN